jgi:hypothetical protein
MVPAIGIERSLVIHRAVIKVTQDSDAVWVHVPWRREDNPEKKAVFIKVAGSI